LHHPVQSRRAEEDEVATLGNPKPTVRELGLLTDSLSSVIRWRFRDYGSILRAELALLAASPTTVTRATPASKIDGERSAARRH
jgi:hypothetical protein